MKKKLLSLSIFLLGLNNIYAQNTLSPNLWTNGDFENLAVGRNCLIFNPANWISNGAPPYFGNSIFIHTASTTSLQPSVVNEPTVDHTVDNLSGHYLYCDPRGGSGTVFQIRKKIKVQPNTNYVFSAWFTSMLFSNSNAPAKVQLRINNTVVSPALTLSGTNTNWMQLSSTNVWNSGMSVEATLEIVDINPNVLGHDFAVDDIFFGTQNLWVNGSFESTTTSYPYSNVFNPANNYSNTSYPYYGFTTFPYVGSGPVIQPQFVNEAHFDHTLGTSAGHFVYCDPRTVTGPTYQIRQYIDVQPYTKYDISAWFTSMLLVGGGGGAKVQLVINDVAVSPILSLNGGTTQWLKLSNTIPWNSDANTVAKVDIIDNNPNLGGHDFAIDDIFFGASGVDNSPLVADAGPVSKFVSCATNYTLGGNPTASGGNTCSAYTYQWSPTTYFVPPFTASSPNPVIKVLYGAGPINYTVTVTDVTGATATDVISIGFDCPNGRPAAINNDIILPPEIRVYPNPAKNLLHIQNLSNRNLSIQIVDIYGRIISKAPSNQDNISLDISKFIAGVYYVRFIDNTGALVQTCKFVKN